MAQATNNDVTLTGGGTTLTLDASGGLTLARPATILRERDSAMRSKGNSFFPDRVYPMSHAMAGVRSYFVIGEDKIVGLVEKVRQQLTDATPADPWSAGEKPQAPAVVQHHQLLTARVGEELFGLTPERIDRILASVRLLHRGAF